MGAILVALLVTIVGGIAVRLFDDGIPALSKWIIWRAAKRLPPRLRLNFKKGCEADLATLETKFEMLDCACGAMVTSLKAEPFLTPYIERLNLKLALWRLSRNVDGVRGCMALKRSNPPDWTRRYLDRIGEWSLNAAVEAGDDLFRYAIAREIRRSGTMRKKVVSKFLFKTARASDLAFLAIADELKPKAKKVD